MSKDLKIKGALSKDYQQIYIDDEPIGVYVNEEGKVKLKDIVVNGEITAAQGALRLKYNDVYANVLDKREGALLSTDGILMLDVDHIKIQSSGVSGTGGIHIADAFTTYQWLIDSENRLLRINDSTTAADTFQIEVDTNGATKISTTDFSGTLGHLHLDSDGSLILDPADGKFIAKNNGTEFSPTDSAYAGMILGYTHLTTTGSTESYALTTSHDVIDADGKVTFVAPPSGNVEIEFSIYRDSVSSNKVIYFSLSDNATYNLATAEIGDGSTSYDLIYGYGFDTADETDDRYVTGKFVVGGLTSGTSYTYWLAGKTNSTSTNLRWGGNTSTTPDRYYPPFVIKATALPASIHTQ
tara:strand:+ start:676 stop:1737 length:1062 start_codon:yes stop_codon:yes gene_type:complete